MAVKFSNAEDGVKSEEIRDTGDYLIEREGQFYYWMDSTSPTENVGPFASRSAAIAAYDAKHTTKADEAGIAL